MRPAALASRPSAGAAATWLAAALLLGGCASPKESAIFFTKTSSTLVDVDAAPASFSIGYDRHEGYAGPRFADGQVFPVASSIETRGTGIDREVRQVFVGGQAARIATRAGETATPGATPSSATGTHANGPAVAAGSAVTAGAAASAGTADSRAVDERRVLYFGTATSVGVKVGFADGVLLPNALALGYKRKELAVVPVDADRLDTSVLGSVSNATGLQTSDTLRASGRFEVQQYFATGDAADQLAGLESIRRRFQGDAERAVGHVEQFREQEALQGRHALDALACLGRVPDDWLEIVWRDADRRGLFAQLGTIPRIRAADDRHERRQLYAESLSLLDPAEAGMTQRLAAHKTLVCGLYENR